MNCPKCQAPAAANALFCGVCGSELPERDAADLPSLGELPTVRGAIPARRFKPGEKLMGRYQVLGELGQGGMGVVYRCLDEVGGIEVALKALPPELSHNSGEMEEVRENFQLVCQLAHPHIATVRTLERDAASGNYYLILELVKGVDLRKWRKQAGGQLALRPTLPILKQIAQALDFAHSRKIIHRDIKPANVMVSADGTVKVLDFGLAAQIQSSLSRVSQVHFSTSGTGPYMAPEQWKGQRQDAATDQYALAVLAYELLSGHLPFESSEATVLQQAVLNTAPEQPEGVSEAIWTALQRGLAKNRSDRFASCGELLEALENKTEIGKQKLEIKSKVQSPRSKVEGETEAIPPSAIGHRPSKMPLVLFAAVVLLLLGVGGWYLGRHQIRKIAETANAEVAPVAVVKVESGPVATKVESDAKEKARLEAEAEKKAAEAKVKAEAEAAHLANACGGVTVETEPPGAKVILGAVDLQASPATFKGVHIGKYPLTITVNGYESWSREVEVKENQFTDLGVIQLVRQTGTVKIESKPPGATVKQGERELGKTPLELTVVPTGIVNYTLALAGFQGTNVSGNVKNQETLPLVATLTEIKPGYLGIFPVDIDPRLVNILQLKSSKGVQVKSVVLGMPAENAGIKPYDVILAVDGKPVANTKDFLLVISQYASGTHPTLDIRRYGTAKSIIVTLDEQPKLTADEIARRTEGIKNTFQKIVGINFSQKVGDALSGVVTAYTTTLTENSFCINQEIYKPVFGIKGKSISSYSHSQNFSDLKYIDVRSDGSFFSIFFCDDSGNLQNSIMANDSNRDTLKRFADELKALGVPVIKYQQP